MPDINFELEIKKLEMRIKQIELTRMGIEIRIAELLDEKNKLELNFASYDRETSEVKEQIASLEKTKEISSPPPKYNF